MSIDFSKTYLHKLHTVTNSLDKVFDQVLRKYAGLGVSQFTLLLSVAQFEPVGQRRVASFLELSPGAVSRQVELARRKGWLKILSDKHDRRAQVLHITPSGSAVVAAGLEALEQHVFQIFDDHDRQVGLMDHINTLLTHTKEVIAEQSKKTE